MITGELHRESQLAYIVIVLVILVIPFKFMDERINQRKIRDLALDTREKIAVDLNFRTLHMVYHPRWELFLGPAAFLYGLFYLQIEQWIVYLFLLFPWFMYLNIRGTRYQTRPYMTDNYLYMFSFNIFSFLFFLFFFCSYFIMKIQALLSNSMSDTSPGPAGFPTLLLMILGYLLILGMIGRIAIYLSNYGAFVKAMKGEGSGQDASPLRKWLFFGAALTLVSGVALIAVFSGILNIEKIEVGVVQEKYVINCSGPAPDTLMIVDASLTGDSQPVYPFFSGEKMSLSCNIRLSRSDLLVNYDVCCPNLFRELPVGSVVKFEYGPGPTIYRLVEY
jgi:hypothetical protein